MNSRVILFTAVLTLFGSGFSLAQEGSFNGKIVDVTTNEAVPYATVRVKSKTIIVAAVSIRQRPEFE